MAQVYTPLAFAAALRAVGGDINRRIGNVIGAGLSRAVKYAVDDFTSKGVGRAIYGAKPGGVIQQKAITRTRVTISGGRVVGGLKAQGFAALQEGGGRTKPHVIEPKNRKMLVFQAGRGSGFFVFASRVQHPGGPVKRYPFLQAAIEKARIAEALDREVSQFLVARLG